MKLLYFLILFLGISLTTPSSKVMATPLHPVSLNTSTALKLPVEPAKSKKKVKKNPKFSLAADRLKFWIVLVFVLPVLLMGGMAIGLQLGLSALWIPLWSIIGALGIVAIVLSAYMIHKHIDSEDSGVTPRLFNVLSVKTVLSYCTYYFAAPGLLALVWGLIIRSSLLWIFGVTFLCIGGLLFLMISSILEE